MKVCGSNSDGQGGTSADRQLWSAAGICWEGDIQGASAHVASQSGELGGGFSVGANGVFLKKLGASAPVPAAGQGGSAPCSGQIGQQGQY